MLEFDIDRLENGNDTQAYNKPISPMVSEIQSLYFVLKWAFACNPNFYHLGKWTVDATNIACITDGTMKNALQYN